MFFFEVNLNIDRPSHRTLIIFSGQLEGSDSDYGSEFEKILERYDVAPDQVIFLYPQYLDREICQLLITGSSFNRNLSRYGDKSEVYIFSFSEFSNLSFVPSVFNKSTKEVEIDAAKYCIITQGVLTLAKKRHDQVIQKAPPGTTFLKPSDDEFDEFIKASELCVGYSEVQFLAYCLLSKRPKGIAISHIWIDTAGIAPVIEALIYYIYKFSSTNGKTVKYHSYRSYDGLETCKPDYVGNIWMIISASTSNNLGKYASEKWGLLNDQVLTILSYKDSDSENIGDEIIANIRHLSSAHQHLRKSGTAIGIRIDGENFTPKYKSPNKVLIKKQHKPKDSVDKFVYPYYSSNVFYCNRVDRSKKNREIYLDTETIIKSDTEAYISSWLSKIVGWHMPVNTEWLVYDFSCLASKALFDSFLKALDVHSLAMPKNVIDVDAAATSISGDGAVIALFPIISSGRSLLKLNRNLRISKHDGNRIFLVPFAVSSSSSSFESFKKTLTMGPGGLKYSFHYRQALFSSPHENLNSWHEESKVVDSFENEFWRIRANQLAAEGTGLIDHVGVSAAPSFDRLRFTNDFAYWPGKYSPNKVNASSVYVTISLILQSLRDKPYADFDTDSLSGSIYQHSVIDPENFFRLDDPLLHSCLWRAALNSELDYSSSPDMTNTFITFFRRLLSDYASGEENAALDVLMGIAVRKIRVSIDALAETVDYALDVLDRNDDAVELIEYIQKTLIRSKLESNVDAPNF